MTGEGEEGHPQGYGHVQGHAQAQDQGNAQEGPAREAVMDAANMMTGGGDHHFLKGH